MQMKSREEAAPELQGRCWTKLQGELIKHAPHCLIVMPIITCSFHSFDVVMRFNNRHTTLQLLQNNSPERFESAKANQHQCA